MKTIFIILLSFFFAPKAISSDSTYFIKVHFIFGSRPTNEFKEVEPKWFGGKYGGHVGIETDSNRVLNFLPRGDFHWFAKSEDRHSAFAVHSIKGFWEMFGLREEDVKRASVIIPISIAQKRMLDSISASYLNTTPYDYAFMGMRCGSSTYEILAKLGLLKQLSYRGTYMKIIYPKKLRKRLYKQAQKKGWKIERYTGTERRVWKVG
jgi:hypothetical protein